MVETGFAPNLSQYSFKSSEIHLGILSLNSTFSFRLSIDVLSHGIFKVNFPFFFSTNSFSLRIFDIVQPSPLDTPKISDGVVVSFIYNSSTRVAFMRQPRPPPNSSFSSSKRVMSFSEGEVGFSGGYGVENFRTNS